MTQDRELLLKRISLLFWTPGAEFTIKFKTLLAYFVNDILYVF